MRINKARNIKSGIKIWVESSHTLTVAELPAHTHGRGTQDITGAIYGRPNDNKNYRGVFAGEDGCFYHDNGWNATGILVQSASSATNKSVFQASRNWSGTSQSIGSGTSIDIMNPYKVAYCFIRLS